LILSAAVEIGLFDHLETPRTPAEMSAATGASERGLRALMNALVGLELLSKDPSGRYALTPESATFLVRSKPTYQGGLLRHIHTQLLPKWMGLEQIVRTGQPAQAVDPESRGAQFFAEFVADLFPLSYPAARALAATLELKSGSVLDLGAGSGVWGIALAQASPQVTVTAVDWPAVLEVTRKMAERCGVGAQLRYVEGDLFAADFGTGRQVATIGHILHAVGARQSRVLLRKTFEALAPGGTVAIAEFLVNEQRTAPAAGLIFAVNMLVNTVEGDTFSFEEIREWLLEAGFVNPRTLDTPGPSPLVLGTKP
jgi:ubiquinone/menaquinone biosynthesis C-methylase UbiE